MLLKNQKFADEIVEKLKQFKYEESRSISAYILYKVMIDSESGHAATCNYVDAFAQMIKGNARFLDEDISGRK